MTATPAQVAAAQEAMGQMNLVAPMRHIFGDRMADALAVLLAQETEVAAVAVADAVAAAGPNPDAVKCQDIGCDRPAVEGRLIDLCETHWDEYRAWIEAGRPTRKATP